VSTSSLITRAGIARMAADTIAHRSCGDCEAWQVSTTGECETAQHTCGPSAHHGPCALRKLGDRMHAAPGDRARVLGWEVIEPPGPARPEWRQLPRPPVRRATAGPPGHAGRNG